MVLGKPRAVAQHPSFRDSLGLLFPQARLLAFAQGAGVDLREIESGVIAGFDLGTLYLFTPPRGAAKRVVQRFRERLVGAERIDQPHPLIERITGTIGNHPQALLRVDEHAIAIAVGDPTLCRIVEAFARKKLHQARPALQGAGLSELEPLPADALASFLAPGPFLGEWALGARGLLGHAVAVSASLVPSSENHVQLLLELAGDFPPTGADDLRAGFHDLARSPTGMLFGLDQLPEPQVSEREGRLLLAVELPLLPIARGLRAAVIADVWEIFDIPRPAKPERP